MIEYWENLIYNGIKEDNRFMISSMGRLKNKNNNHIYKLHINNEGYYQVCVSNGSRKNKKVIKIHIAVAKAFIKCNDNNLIVNHKDLNKLNNNYSNLEWITYSENTKHAINNKALDIKKPVKQIHLENNNVLNIFDSCTEAANHINNNNVASVKSGISKAVRGIYKTAFGYKWELVDKQNKTIAKE